MSYLGNAKTPLIFGPNTRDDIVPDGETSIFNLSQEVPGGYEHNVMVLRQRYIVKPLVSNSANLVFGTGPNLADTISTTDQDLAAALSRVAEGDYIVISGTGVSSVGTYKVSDVEYNGSEVTIRVIGDLQNDSGDTNVVLEHGFYSPWEVLDPEKDYTIGGTGEHYNKQISFSIAPAEEESIYVLHRGEATYNFVPTAGSVGPDQLQENLRNFVTDRFTGDDIEIDFTLSQDVVDSRSLIVTLDGIVVDGDSLGFSSGSWSLTESVPSSGVYDQVTFDVAPATGVAIRVLHLGFSSVSRRALYSPAQSTLVVPPNSVGTVELQNNSVTASKLADNSISSSKIGSDAVDGENILLNNNEALRSKLSTTGNHPILKLDTTDNVEISSPNNIKIDSSIIPTESSVDLGTSSSKFNNAFVAGNTSTGTLQVSTTITNTGGVINTGTVNVTGNINVDGTVDGVDVSALKQQVDGIGTTFPTGCVIPFAGNVLPVGWLWADGSTYLSSEYTYLFQQIGYTYGGANGNFNVPDLTMRFPIGFGGDLTTLGAKGGQFDHVHELPDHTHEDAHTHTVAGHNHEASSALGSTLSIALSGNHQTTLDHAHGNINTALGGTHRHDLGNTGNTFASTHPFASDETAGSFVPTHNHQILGVTGNQSANHTHTIDTFNELTPDLDKHTHSVKTVALENSGNLNSSSNYHFVVGLPNTVSSSITRNLNTLPDGNHSHDFTIVTNVETSVPNTLGSNHTHSLDFTTPNSGAHKHIIRGIVPDSLSSHQHTISIPNYVGKSTADGSDGRHIHQASDFTGKIGKVTGGVSGDVDIQTGNRSTTKTGQISSPGPGSSAGANPPYIVLRYIIKY